jgi:RNA polymerase sigma factor (sigma-70 family)
MGRKEIQFRLTDQQRNEAEQFMPMAYHAMKHAGYRLCYSDRQELLSDLYYSICRLMKKYNPQKGTRGYIYARLHNSCRDFMRKRYVAKKHGFYANGHDAVDDTRIDETGLSKWLNQCLAKETWEQVLHDAQLTGRELDILMLYTVYEWTFKAIGKKYGTSRSTAFYRFNKALTKTREAVLKNRENYEDYWLKNIA